MISVTSAGRASGSTIDHRMRKCAAPSMVADSNSSCGSVRKKLASR